MGKGNWKGRLCLEWYDDESVPSCIVVSVAESLYGMSERQKNDALFKMPDEYMKILKRVYR